MKKFAIAMLLAGGPGTSLAAQSDEDRDRPRVSTQMHGADAANPAPDTERTTVPETLGAPAYFGQIAFERACSSCHGTNGAGGTGTGPPLIHPVYEPGHHGDTAGPCGGLGPWSEAAYPRSARNHRAPQTGCARQRATGSRRALWCGPQPGSAPRWSSDLTG